MRLSKEKKRSKIKVLVVHPTKSVRDRVAAYMKAKFNCKVTTTTNYDRAVKKLEKAAQTGGPAASFHIVVTGYDISSPQLSLHNQGVALVEAIRNNPLTKNISIILEKAHHQLKVNEVDADFFVPSLEKLEGQI
jgi:CheY-like chemotaxis protein